MTLAAGPVRRLLFRGRLREQRNLQNVFNVLDEVEGHVALDRLGDVDQIALVELRQDHRVELRRPRGQNLFLHATDGQHVAAQRDFAGHGDVAPNRTLSENGDDRRGNGDARRWPVFRNGARGNVNVNVVRFEVIRWNPVLVGVGARIRQRGLRGFLHHLAELPGELQLAFAANGRGLDEENVAADRGP